MRPLLPSLPLHFGGEAGQPKQDLLGGRVERPLLVSEVVEDPHAGIEDLLDDVRRLDLLSPEPALLAHDEHLERGARPKRVQQPRQPRPLPELGPTDPIVHEDVLVPNDPAVGQGRGPGMLDLPGDGPLLVRDTDLLR
jgi:hypothetical protein